MFHLSFIALCCASIITCSPTKNHVFELDVEYPPSTDQDSTVNFVSTKNRIINGVDAPNTPWVARIIINYNRTQISSTSFYLVIVSDCGGSLVSPHWVLSARHCFFDGDDQTKLTTNKFWVSVGNVDFFRGQIIPASNVAVFNQYNNGDDLALLRLVNDVSIQPISVQYDDNINYEGKRATIYGWGWTETFHRSPRVLQTADVVLYGRDQCDRNQVCANPTITKTNACQSDSGGPLVLQENGKLIGIVAAGLVVNDVPCQGDKSFYTSTSYYASWIQRIIQD
ncbi:chymotrypsin-1-like [Chrysoperla carnea]|uniref:chymotrypsin-1-like n=1 Tax=Chrysoperla carnea TaxID=189513 RepID=UPI001D085893|nr:chymotrypsin-1-like [Chrysoperla carnea]